MWNGSNNSFRFWFSKIRQKVKKIKKEVGALYLAYKRPDVPRYAKLICILVVGYALSPIDLIPDFIPVLGYLDDLILLPLGITFAIKLIPKNSMDECRQQSENIFSEGKPQSWAAGSVIILIWIIIISYILIKII